ncbi:MULTISPECIES: MFS transporter [Streptomyces]|uniref:MFS transporter n=1 Tax=Streptomyces TaxID=1883 RepID=UPI0022A9BCE5|nr:MULTISPECIES: MFS transporter [Streptomyces]UFQ15855.1 MFS transporter [Streptomyces huasconensis]WCL85459.1 MFS transporter [Streptomyces sp. JCM 35825]
MPRSAVPDDPTAPSQPTLSRPTPAPGAAPRTAHHAAARTPRPGATLAVTSAATSVALMTYTAPAVILPDTAASLGTSLTDQAWLLNGTPLGLAAFLLAAGSVADDHGRRRVFLWGTAGLGVTTTLGALAQTTLLFTLARIAQGAASAAILATSLGLLVHAFPAGHGRVRATGIWGACVSGGIAVGPLLAGAIAAAHWRWAYVVMGALSLLVAAFAPRALTESRTPRGGRTDLAGALLLGLAATALVAALTVGRDGWLRAPVGALLLAAVLLTAAFAAVERRATAPVLDLGLLRRPLFLASSVGALFTGFSVIALFSYLPALLQHTIGMSAMGAAWLIFLWSGASFAVALQARRLGGRISARHQLALGFALHAVAVLTMLGAAASGSWLRLLPGLVISGAGSGLLNAALPLLAVESVPADRAAMGSGAGNTARYIGSAAGVALMIAVSTASGDLAHGADVAMVVSAGLGVLAAAGVLLLRERRG